MGSCTAHVRFHPNAYLYRNIRTYKCRSAAERRYHFGMWKKIGTATMTTTAITAWFAVVALGLVGQLWPLLEGVP